MDQSDLENPTLRAHRFLQVMYEDGFFPDALVDRGAALLVALCAEIEAQRPQADADVLELTHATTEAFNALAEAFEAQGSEIETVAREAIAEDFEVITKAYGFDLDIEDVISPRDW